jgi:hypothetical protein
MPSEFVPIRIEYTGIRQNRDHGITLANVVFPQIHYNSFFGTGAGTHFGLNHIWLVNGYPGSPMPQLDATCNFWGGTVSDVSEIEAWVRDMQDTGLVGTDLIVSPWSNEDPTTSTSTCVVP